MTKPSKRVKAAKSLRMSTFTHQSKVQNRQKYQEYLVKFAKHVSLRIVPIVNSVWI